MERDEPEHPSIYDAVTLDKNEDREALIYREQNREEALVAAAGRGSDILRTTNDNVEHRHQGVAARWNVGSGDRLAEVKAQWQLNFEASDSRWDDLYDEGEHHRLKYALLESVSSSQKKKRTVQSS